MSEILFAAEIAFGCLNGCMPQQELNLLQFAPAAVAQLRAGSPQIMRCNVLQACSLAAGSDQVPDNVLREAAAPHLSPPGDRSKNFALTNPSGSRPVIERLSPSSEWARCECGHLCQSDQQRPSVLGASGCRPTPNRPVPTCESRNRTAWPTSHNRAWRA